MAEPKKPEMPIFHHKIDPDDLPFRLEVHDEATGELLWEADVTGPGALKIPGFSQKCLVTVIDKDGHVEVKPQRREKNLIAGRPVNPDDYPPDLRAVWYRGIRDMQARGEPPPPIYPGSIEGHCSWCGIRITVGPMQQRKLAESGMDALVVCLICATILIKARAGGYDIRSLGNPYTEQS
jgi:hypothetical protein